MILTFTLGYFSPFVMISPTSSVGLSTSSVPSSSVLLDNTPLDSDGIQPVGNATIEDIKYIAPGQMETTVGIDPTTISMEYIGYEFLGVQQIATAEFFAAQYLAGNIEVRINESVRFSYWDNDSLTLLNFKSELSHGEIIEMYINSTPIADISDVTLSFAGGFNFNYSEYHSANPIGTLDVNYIFDYNITMYNWRLMQKKYPYSPQPNPFITKNRTEITSFFNYTWETGEFAVDCTIDLLVNIPDIEYLQNLQWRIRHNIGNTTDFSGYTQLVNNTFRLSDLKIDRKTIIINFETNHTLEIVNKFSDYWLRDYLVEGNSKRGRDFDISVVEGPPTIFVSNFQLNLTDIFHEEFISVSSAFNRTLTFKDTYRDFDRTQNGTTLEFFGTLDFVFQDYYLLLGETDTITVTYKAISQLEFKVVDKINNPLRNAEVFVYFGNATYGTYISEETSIPYAAKLTDVSGVVSIDNVPRGNYLVDVYYKGKIVADDISVNTESTDQIVPTSVPHFPLWIILFASFSTLTGLIGYIIFKKARS